MPFAILHSLRRQRPNLVLEVNFIPTHAAHLGKPLPGENEHFDERAKRPALGSAACQTSLISSSVSTRSRLVSPAGGVTPAAGEA